MFRGQRLGGAIAAVICFGWFATTSRAADATPAPAFVLALPPLGDGESDYCGTCTQGDCPVEEHRFEDYTTGGADQAFHEGRHDCESGWCSEAHPEASVCRSEDLSATREEVVMVWEAVQARASSGDLKILLSLMPGRASYNASRNAIQMIGCGPDGAQSVRANIPLARDQAMTAD